MKPRLFTRVLRFMSERRILSDARMLELYPPFLFMRIKVLEMDRDWRRVRIRLPLNAISRNPGGVMFGGFQAALADPIAALACARVFPGYSTWTRAMQIDFEHGGITMAIPTKSENPTISDSKIPTHGKELRHPPIGAIC